MVNKEINREYNKLSNEERDKITTYIIENNLRELDALRYLRRVLGV